MKNVHFWIRHMESHVLAFPETSLTCGLPRMTVGAEDLALRHFFQNRRPSEARYAHGCDVLALVPEVVELEDDGVSLAALNAREEPVSAGTSAGRAWIKGWDSNRCRYTCDGLIR